MVSFCNLMKVDLNPTPTFISLFTQTVTMDSPLCCSLCVSRGGRRDYDLSLRGPREMIQRCWKRDKEWKFERQIEAIRNVQLRTAGLHTATIALLRRLTEWIAILDVRTDR